MSRPDIRKSNPFGRPTLSELADDLTLTGGQIVPVQPRMRVTRTGLEGEAATLDEWEAFGATLRDVEGGIQWAIGDWLNQGHRRWGEKYAGVVEQLGFEPDTLKDYAYVSNNVEMSVRTDKLTWSHHKLVASLAADDQREWLDLAEREGWPVARLRREIADEHAPRQIEAAPPPTFVTQHAADTFKHLSKLTPEKIGAMDADQLREARQQHGTLTNSMARLMQAIQQREQALRLEELRRK